MRVIKCLLLFLIQSSFAQFQWNIFQRGASNESFIPDSKELKTSYDFIIIGAGSAGCVVANRLTENPKWDVLLIEAGEDESFFTDIPLLQAGLGVTQYNWGYTAEKQKKACLLLKNGVCSWPMGKGVGGTSIIYDMLYNRGNKYDYDSWASSGNTGWSYNDVLPYFIKSERAVGMNDIDTEFHGFNGYFNVEHTPYRSKLVDAFLDSAPEFNQSYVDINGRNPKGFAPVQSGMKSGRKSSVSKAFLRPIRSRANLHLTKRSFVTKIIIDPVTKQTTGVHLMKNNKLYEIKARKEVILSAGSTKSPQVLMLSGIGPKQHLEDLNITLIQDLDVGHNLQDHISFPGLVFLVNQSISLTGPKILSVSAVTDYLVRNKGPYTVPGGAEAYAFLNTEFNGIKDENFVDIEIILAGAALNSDTLGIVRNLLRISDRFYDTVYNGIKDVDSFAMVPVLLKPFSRGRIMLRSNDPFDRPLIYPNFFDDDRDLNLLVKGVQLVSNMAEVINGHNVYCNDFE